MPAPSRFDLEKAARQFFDQLVQELDRPRDFPEDDWDNQIAHQIELSRERIGALDRQLVTRLFDQKIKVRAATLVEEMGNALEGLDEADQNYAMQITARAERESLELLIHQLLKPARIYDVTDHLFRSEVNETTSVSATPSTAGTSAALQDTIERYLGWLKKKNLSQSRVDETSRVLEWLVQRVGNDRFIGDIDKSEMRQFRDDIERLNGSLQGRKAPFNERQTNNPKDQIKSVTAIRYWRSITGFFSWAHEEGHGPSDPTNGLKIAAKKGETKRTPEPFDQAELEDLFSTPLFAGHQSAKRVSDVGDCHHRRGQWWSAVLLAHTGMRASELCQLTAADFVFDDEIPHLKVRRENNNGEATKTTKNVASIRDIPLAPVLIDLGLEQFVRTRSKTDRLFIEFHLGNRGRKSDGATKFWTRYLQKFDLWKPGRATHVWRHTMIACLRRNGATDEDIAAFVGHSGKTVTSSYGGPQPLQRKALMLDKLDYGFDILDALGGAYVKIKHL